MATYERIDYGSDDGSQWGGASTDKLGFYGAVPVVRRTFVASLHNTTATHLAVLQEVMNTLRGLGVWATA